MFGVLSLTLTHFLAKTIFPEGMGLYIILVEILEGWGMLLLCLKTDRRGVVDIFWNYTLDRYGALTFS